MIFCPSEKCAAFSCTTDFQAGRKSGFLFLKNLNSKKTMNRFLRRLFCCQHKSIYTLLWLLIVILFLCTIWSCVSHWITIHRKALLIKAFHTLDEYKQNIDSIEQINRDVTQEINLLKKKIQLLKRNVLPI